MHRPRSLVNGDWADLTGDFRPDRRRRDPLRWHTALSATLGETTNSHAALAALCEAVRVQVPCDRVQVWRGDLRQMTMRTLISAGYDERAGRRLAALAVPLHEMPLTSEFMDRKYLAMAGVHDIGGYGTVLFDSFGIQATAFLLLERGDRVLGAMQLSWCDTPGPDFPVPEIADVIRRYAGLAVDIHARSDEALQTATTLTDTAMLLASIHDPDELLEAMARRTAEAIGCDWGVVYLRDETSGVLRYAAGAGPLETLAAARRMEATEAVAVRALAESEDDLVEVADVRTLDALAPCALEDAISSFLSVPLRLDGRLTGTLTLGYLERTGRFARRQVGLAKGLAHHACAALENARLVRSLREASQAKSDFVAAVSHDLRTPLHILIGYNDMLLEGEAGALTSPQAELVGRVRDCSVRFLDLIDGILEVARLDAGQSAAAATSLDLHALCDGIAREVAPLVRPEVVVSWTAADTPIAGDAAKIRMILRNLVTNALKFTTAGRVDVRCDVAPGSTLVLRVADTGPGIGPEERERIFEMFQQGDAGRRAGGSGLGLGLYLVRRLTAVLGGTVALVSGDPGNTVFEVTLPAPG
jgi:signal transduction histidine kinase